MFQRLGTTLDLGLILALLICIIGLQLQMQCQSLQRLTLLEWQCLERFGMQVDLSRQLAKRQLPSTVCFAKSMNILLECGVRHTFHIKAQPRGRRI